MTQFIYRGLVLACIFVVSVFFFPTAINATPIGIGPAKALVKFTLINNTGDKVTDYHIQIVNEGGIGNRQVSIIPPFTNLDQNEVSDDKTTLDIGLSGGMIQNKGKVMFGINLNSEKNEVKIKQSFFTKDGKRVPNKDAFVPVPGFEVQNDPEYTIFNDFDVAIEIRGLQFLVNSPELDFFTLDPGGMGGFAPPVANFILNAHSSMTFTVSGNLDAGRFLYAQGQFFDVGTGEMIGSFIQGHQQATPEPATMLLLGTGLAGVAIKMSKRLKTRKGAQGSQ